MGVTGLWKLIDQSGKPVPVDTLENKVLAVDISIWLHQVVKGFQDSNGATLPNAHLLGLFHRLCKLMYYRIKPIFVFDGGVPALKRETIAKRTRNKNKYQSEADKLQHLLLEALAKEKVVQQALGPSASLLINGNRKAIQKADDNDENDLFKLPPMQENLPQDDSQTDISESDGSFDEKQRTVYNYNLQQIDVKSSHFQSLPADIRHEILSDIKETRKQSSWGRLHELPVESQSFSSFQMKKLLRRRQVQVELEEAEKEMGGKGLSMAELENLLSEEGVVDPDIITERVASNEHVRYLHVRDITKALKKEAEETIKKEPILDAIKEEEAKVPLNDIIKDEQLTEEDFDLQRAIQMSLGGADPADCAATEESDTLRLTVEQRKALGSAANSLARHYMVEYGGLNDDEVSDLVKIDESVNKQTQEFKFNDDSIIFGKGIETKPHPVSDFKAKEISQKLVIEKEKTVNMSESSSDEDMLDVSSDIDSDFVDVPEVESDVDHAFLFRSQFPLPPPFLMNEPPAANNADAKIEVVINPGQMCNIKDDIFADIFGNPDDQPIANEKQSEERFVEKNEIIEIGDDNDEDEEVNSKKDKEIEVKSKPTAEFQELSKTQAVIAVPEPIKQSSNSKIQSILSGLDNERSSITKLSLDDILGTKSNDDVLAKLSTNDKPDILEKLEKDMTLNEMKSLEKINTNLPSNTTPTKSATSKAAPEEETTPTKIPQPFFVKKTPPSSKKKSPASASGESPSTPSKVSKSLTEVFECLPSTSAQAISEEETMAMAANVLREKKTKEELQDIAEQLNQERRDLAAERNKRDRLGVSITEQMSMECMELLKLFGVPYIIAPMEAEAQCAYLNEINLTDGTITDDSDIWLFGGRTVYKNFFDQNKHVLEFKSDNIVRLFHLDREKLIQLSFLVGSDYTQGIHGIGAVTALEILSLFTATPEKDGETTQIVSILSSLRKFRDWWFNKTITQRTHTLRSKLKNITIGDDFPNPRVVEAYLFPTVDENREKFSWGKLEVESIREYAKKTFGWTNKRTDEIIMPVVKRLGEKKSQQSIQNYFKITDISSRKDLKVSKRVRTALNQLSGDPDDPDAPIEIDDDVEEKKPKKKTTKTTKATNAAKPRRKRKAATETVQEDKQQSDGAEPKEDPTSTVNDKPTNTVNDDDDDDCFEVVAVANVKPKVKPQPKSKPKATRKRKADTEQEKSQVDDNSASCSSENINISIGVKKVVLPDNNAPIPQREMDKQIMEQNKLKAIEILKKAKTGKKK